MCTPAMEYIWFDGCYRFLCNSILADEIYEMYSRLGMDVDEERLMHSTAGRVDGCSGIYEIVDDHLYLVKADLSGHKQPRLILQWLLSRSGNGRLIQDPTTHEIMFYRNQNSDIDKIFIRFSGVLKIVIGRTYTCGGMSFLAEKIQPLILDEGKVVSTGTVIKKECDRWEYYARNYRSYNLIQ